MTQFDPTDDDLDEDADPTGTDDLSNLRKQLRQSQRNNKALAGQLEEASSVRKENAFLKAGLPDSPSVKFFQDHYDGDPTPEAIKAAAAQYGFIPEVSQQMSDDIAALDKQSEAVTGATESLNPDSEEAMLKELDAVLRKGGNAEAVLRKYGRPVASDNR